MTPEKSIEARKSSGSPNLLEQEEMIKSLSQGIANYSTGIQKRTRMVEGSFDTLERTVKNYLSVLNVIAYRQYFTEIRPISASLWRLSNQTEQNTSFSLR